MASVSQTAVTGSAIAHETPARASGRRAAVGAFLHAHGLLVGCVGIFTGVLAARLPKEVGQDTWLSLLVGRRIAHTGIPHHDVFTTWTLGQAWVDQQWLAHLLSYGIYAVGGLTLLAVCHILLVAGAVGGAVGFARRSGAAARTIAWLLVLTIYPILLASGTIRTQSFVLPLFVAVLGLLISDSRRPSNAVFWALPMLVLWANLHGSVVVGAGLVALRGILGLRDRPHRVRYALLTIAAPVCLLLTPYGFGVVDYYHHTLANPSFRHIVTEWASPTPSLVNAPIFLLMGAAIWLLARNTKAVGLFGVLAEIALIVLSLGAIRSVVWLGLGSIVLLAPALDRELGGRELAIGKMNRTVAIVGVYFVVLISVITLWGGDSGLTKSDFPTAAGNVVARAVAAQPNRHVYSSERFADWLLFEHPELTGHVAYDARFEMLSADQLQQIYNWTNQLTPHWRAAPAGSQIIVVDMSDGPALAKRLASDPRLRKTYEDKQVAIFLKTN